MSNYLASLFMHFVDLLKMMLKIRNFFWRKVRFCSF